ncbi:MAG TPA: hypothetical protein VGR67_02680 [Candidatus Polarisedimenticolia bacterium]|jgi:hypothetical protein|nr:hypothetical protein [Candidatus Polarisedimenticolia bacterium]
MRRTALVASIFLFASSGSVRADVVHLKDGRSLEVEGWRVEGDQILLEIPAGNLTIPRSLVVRIEPSSPAGQKVAGEPPAPADSAPHKPSPRPVRALPGSPKGKPLPAPPPLPPPPAVSSKMSDQDLREAMEALKRDLRDEPRRREPDSREIARGLCVLAARSEERHEFAAAEASFREALTYDSQCLPAHVGLSNLFLKQGKDLYARAQIQEGLLAFPRDASLHYLLGLVYYRQENLADAISEWQLSRALRDDERVASLIEKAKRELRVERDYARTEALHFILRYEGGGPSISPIAAALRDTLEEKYRELAERFQFIPPAPIVVILYPAEKFYDATRMPASVAGLFDGKVRIPLGGVKAMNPEVRAVLTHELTHAFVHGKSGGNCPRWLQEGLAQLVEGRPLLFSEERSLARDLAASEGRSWYAEFSYPSSLSFTRYLAGRFGFDALVDTLDRMRAGLSTEEALKEVVREDFADLQKGWMEDLLKKFAERS